MKVLVLALIVALRVLWSHFVEVIRRESVTSLLLHKFKESWVRHWVSCEDPQAGIPPVTGVDNGVRVVVSVDNNVVWIPGANIPELHETSSIVVRAVTPSLNFRPL